MVAAGRPAERTESILASLLVTGEMALAIVLLAGAGVMIRSFLKIHTADMGVKTDEPPDRISLTLPAAQISARRAKISFLRSAQNTSGSDPGRRVRSDGGRFRPGARPAWPYELAWRRPPATRGRPTLPVMTVGPGYFRTLGAAVLSGREFNDHDGASGAPVAIVNQRFASKYWPGEDPLGKRLRLFDGNTPRSVADRGRRGFEYRPERRNPAKVRSRGLLALPAKTARSHVGDRANGRPSRQSRNRLSARGPGAGSRSADVMAPSLCVDRLEVYWDNRFYGILFLIFAAIALLLASVGLYAVIAHSVSQRTQEIGIRMAIGATARDIRKLVFMQGMLPLGIGLAIGLAASLAVNRAPEVHAGPGFTVRPDHAHHRIRGVDFVGRARLSDSGAPCDARRSGCRAQT